MTDYGVFAATEKSDVPYAFVVDKRAVSNLLMHGIVVEQLNAPAKLRVSEFVVARSEHAEREFQKHHEMTLSGKWKDRESTLDEGDYIVRMDQPLGRLAFYLLDPRSDDGLVEWNFFEDAPLPRKIMKRTPLVTTVVRAAE